MMDDVAATTKGGVDRSFDREEDENDAEMENSIAGDFGSYDCFMEPFYIPDERDEQTMELEVECFNQVEKNNTRHQVSSP